MSHVLYTPSNDSFTADVLQGAAHSLVMLHGELDATIEPQLRDRLEEVITPGVNLHIDLSDVSLLDSSCVSALITTARRVRENGGDFSMTMGSRAPRLVIEVHGLGEYFGVVDPRDRRTGAFGARG